MVDPGALNFFDGPLKVCYSTKPMNDTIQKYITGTTAVKIVEGIETAIRSGDLRPGAPLPTIRELAGRLAASPTTVAAAYKTLRLRGMVVAEGRRGTRVGWPGVVHPRLLVPVSAGALDLASGNPDPAHLPSMAPALRAIDASPVLYGQALNLPALVEIVTRDFAADGVPDGPVCVVGGAIAGIAHVLRAALRPGDRVAVEDPGYSGIYDAIVSLGLSLLPVRVDREGPRVDSLRAALGAGARALVLTPRGQNPTGAALTARRVQQLRRVVRPAPPEFIVVEDDHAGLIAGAPPLFVNDGHRPRWAIVRSFAKALNPDLRLAVLTGDAGTMAAVEDRMVVGERWVSHILQRIAAYMLADPAVRAELVAAADSYRRRRDGLVAALRGAGIFDASAPSGLNVWLRVAEETPVVQALLLKGWAVAAGERFRLASGPAIRITSARLPEHDAPRLAADIAAVLRHGGRGSAV